VPAFIDPRAGRAELAPQMNGARSKPRYTGILQIPVEKQTMIKTHGNFVGRSTTKNYSFDSTPFPQIATLMEIPQGNTMENSGK
jgi:hypothetical protein